jgi:hypothetical protein
MTTFGVICFVVGVAALALLAIRRGRNLPVGGSDYLMAFVGLATVIAGLALFFMYAVHV